MVALTAVAQQSAEWGNHITRSIRSTAPASPKARLFWPLAPVGKTSEVETKSGEHQ